MSKHHGIAFETGWVSVAAFLEGNMQSASDITRMTNVARMAKETFWLSNKHLDLEERQRRWSIQVAELSSVLGTSAPQSNFDLDSVPEHPLDESQAQPTGINLERRDEASPVYHP